MNRRVANCTVRYLIRTHLHMRNASSINWCQRFSNFYVKIRTHHLRRTRHVPCMDGFTRFVDLFYTVDGRMTYYTVSKVRRTIRRDQDASSQKDA